MAIEVDDFPDLHPTFSIHDLANTPQTIDKLKDRLRELVADPGATPGDPHAQKFAILKADLEGRDIGDL